MARTPKWASELTARVCAAHHVPAPEIRWRKRRKRVVGSVTYPPSESSSGSAYTTQNRVAIRAGSSRRDQKLVLLHELAHILCPKHHHDQVFWAKAWELYRTYKVPVRCAQRREFGYKRGARTAYLKLIARPRPSKPKPTIGERRQERLKLSQEMLAKWTRKLALAKTKVRKYGAKVRGLTRAQSTVDSEGQHDTLSAQGSGQSSG